MPNPWDNDPIVSQSPFQSLTIGRRDPKKEQDAAAEAERLRLAKEAAAREAAKFGERNDPTLKAGYRWKDGKVGGVAEPIPGIPVEDNGSNQQLTQLLKLRADYDGMPGVKEYRVAVPQLAQGLNTKNTPQGDLALIYAYAKIMDPGSVVREGEAAAVASSDTIAGQLVAKLRKQLEGTGTFSPEARANLRREMLGKATELNRAYTFQRERYSNDAKAFGIDPERIIGKHDGAPFLPEIERHVKEQGLAGSGPAGVAEDPSNLASGGDSGKSIPVPPEMQAAHRAYLAVHKGNLNPDDYANFRAHMDEEYGFGKPSAEQMKTYRDYAAEPGDKGPIAPMDAKMTGRDKFNASLFNDNLTGGKLGSFIMGAGSLGGGMDELVGAGKALATGGDISTNIAQMDAMRQAAAKANPGSSLLGNIGGSILAGVATGGLAPGLEAAAGTVPGAIGIGAGYGALSGALEDNNDRLGGAAIGATAGAGGGLAGKYVVGPAAERLARTSGGQALAAKIAELRGQSFNPAPQLNTAESAILANNPDFAQISTNLRDAADLGLPYSLADADPKLRMFGGTVSRKSPDARTLAEQTFDPRARGQADRAVSAIDTHLAPVTDIKQRGAELLAAGDQAAGPAYNLAARAPLAADPQIDAMLGTPAGRASLANARTIALNEGRDPTSLGFVLDDAGNVTLHPPPAGAMDRFDSARNSWDAANQAYEDAVRKQQASLNPSQFTPEVQRASSALDAANRELDDAKSAFAGAPKSTDPVLANQPTFQSLQLTKRGLDQHLNSYRDQFGNLNLRGNPMAQSVNDLRGRFVGRLGELNPDYAEGNRIWSGFAQRKDALDMGHGVLPNNAVPYRDFDASVAGLTDETLPEAQRGYATSMADQANKVRLSANPFEAIYGSPLQQQKVERLFPAGAGKFDRNYALESDMTKTRGEILGGSQTAARLGADEALSNNLGTMAIDAGSNALTGGGFSAGSALMAARQAMGDGIKLGVGKAAERKAAEIAPTLFDVTNPNAVADLVDELSGKYADINARRAAYARRAALFGALGVPAVTPSGT